MIRYDTETLNPDAQKILPHFKLVPGQVEVSKLASANEIQQEYGLDVISSNGEIYHVKPNQLALTWKDASEEEAEAASASTTSAQVQGEGLKGFGIDDEETNEQASLVIFGEFDPDAVFGSEGRTLKSKPYTDEELSGIANTANTQPAVLVVENSTDPSVQGAVLTAQNNGVPVAVWSIARDQF